MLVDRHCLCLVPYTNSNPHNWLYTCHVEQHAANQGYLNLCRAPNRDKACNQSVLLNTNLGVLTPTWQLMAGMCTLGQASLTCPVKMLQGSWYRKYCMLQIFDY